MVRNHHLFFYLIEFWNQHVIPVFCLGLPKDSVDARTLAWEVIPFLRPTWRALSLPTLYINVWKNLRPNRMVSNDKKYVPTKSDPSWVAHLVAIIARRSPWTWPWLGGGTIGLPPCSNVIRYIIKISYQLNHVDWLFLHHLQCQGILKAQGFCFEGSLPCPIAKKPPSSLQVGTSQSIIIQYHMFPSSCYKQIWGTLSLKTVDPPSLQGNGLLFVKFWVLGATPAQSLWVSTTVTQIIFIFWFCILCPNNQNRNTGC